MPKLKKGSTQARSTSYTWQNIDQENFDKELGIPKLVELIESNKTKELIIATSPTIEGDATSYYIKDQISTDVVLVTRIAYGVPMGGELEYVDNTTLGRAISGRRRID